MRTFRDLVKVYTPKSMTLRIRKTFCKTSVIILTNLS